MSKMSYILSGPVRNEMRNTCVRFMHFTSHDMSIYENAASQRENITKTIHFQELYICDHFNFLATYFNYTFKLFIYNFLLQ